MKPLTERLADELEVWLDLVRGDEEMSRFFLEEAFSDECRAEWEAELASDIQRRERMESLIAEARAAPQPEQPSVNPKAENENA